MNMENYNQNYFAVKKQCLLQHGLQPQAVLLMLLHCFSLWLVNCKVVIDLGWMVTTAVNSVNWFVQQAIHIGGKRHGVQNLFYYFQDGLHIIHI